MIKLLFIADRMKQGRTMAHSVKFPFVHISVLFRSCQTIALLSIHTRYCIFHRPCLSSLTVVALTLLVFEGLQAFWRTIAFDPDTLNPSEETASKMAEVAVLFLLKKLSSLLEEEVKLWKGLKEAVEFAKDEFERMAAFLRVADAMEDSDPELKVWVKQVRDVAYDTEAILNRWLLHRMQNDRKGLGKFAHSVKSSSLKRKIATEIASIKPRICSVSERHLRYRYKFNFSEPGSSSLPVAVSNTLHDRRADALVIEEEDLVGIGSRKKELIEKILEGDSGLRVVPVVGMGGLGKTTLVKKVYDDSAFKKNFQNHAWITVSQSFKLEDLLKDILQQLLREIKQPVPPEVQTMNASQLKEAVKQFLWQRRYFLVFDDVWSIDAWDGIKYALPKNTHGSRVVITTRLIDVGSYSCKFSDGNIYELKPLSSGESWTLLCRKTFHGSSCPGHLKEVSLSMLRKCAGLPLAIVAISGVLATKSTTRIDEWQMLNQSLGAELEGNDKLDSLKLILALSFNDLPYYLKSCFLYLSLYPEDYVIDRNRLIRQWMAEGFVKPTGGRTPEEVAEGYLNELINRNLLLVEKFNDDASFKCGRFHDFLRGMLLSKSREQNFAVIADEHDVAWQDKVRRLSINGNLPNMKQKRCGSHLLSLLAFDVDGTTTIPSLLAVLSNCRTLKVLDLTGASLDKCPEAIFTLLLLTYLCLRSTRVKILPRSIGKLRKLEVPDLKQTYVTELPYEILKLQNLRHLLIYHAVEYSYLPFDNIIGFKSLEGMGKLTSLQKLSMVEATPGTGILTQLGTMSELRRVGIRKLRREDGLDLCTSIEKLHKLRALSLTAIEEEEILGVQFLSSPPPFLQRLYLQGRLEKFPQWIQSLSSLVKVYFKWSRLEDNPLEYLQDLPNLIHLEFLVGYVGTELHFKAGKFLRLKLLDLDELKPLRRVTIGEGAMPNLEKVIIQRCDFLERVPTGIEALNNMKYLEFFDMPDEFISRIQLQGEDYCKVAHIPEVYYTYWRDGGWEAHPLESDHKQNRSSPPKTVSKGIDRRNSM